MEIQNRKRRVLVVDDDPNNLKFLREILEDDYIISCASSGEEALEKVNKFKPELVLLDIMMPGISGYEVCERIRQDKATSFIKIVFISAKAMNVERQRGYEVGGDDYITKPFDHEELQLKVNYLFESNHDLFEDDKQKKTLLLLNKAESEEKEEKRVHIILNKLAYKDLHKLYSISTSIYPIARHDLKALFSHIGINTTMLNTLIENHKLSNKEKGVDDLAELIEELKSIKDEYSNTLKTLSQSFANYYGGYGNTASSFLTNVYETVNSIFELNEEKAHFRLNLSNIKGVKVLYPRNIFYGIISELIGNAIKHNKKKIKIEIDVTIENSNSLKIQFQDNGSGIVNNLSVKELSLFDLRIEHGGLGYIRDIIEKESEGKMLFQKPQKSKGTTINILIPIIGYCFGNKFFYGENEYKID